MPCARDSEDFEMGLGARLQHVLRSLCVLGTPSFDRFWCVLVSLEQKPDIQTVT